MAGVPQRNPEDHEAAIFHALAILGMAYNSPPDKTYARQKQVAEILNRLLPLEPEHPGIAHYMIHSFDYPELAELALPAARAYAKIAPFGAARAAHAVAHLHAPRDVAGVDRVQPRFGSRPPKRGSRRLIRARPRSTPSTRWTISSTPISRPARTQKAREIVDSTRQVKSFDIASFAAGYALAAIPARYTLETPRLEGGGGARPSTGSFPWAKYPYAEAIVHFARRWAPPAAGTLGRRAGRWRSWTAIQNRASGPEGLRLGDSSRDPAPCGGGLARAGREEE